MNSPQSKLDSLEHDGASQNDGLAASKWASTSSLKQEPKFFTSDFYDSKLDDVILLGGALVLGSHAQTRPDLVHHQEKEEQSVRDSLIDPAAVSKIGTLTSVKHTEQPSIEKQVLSDSNSLKKISLENLEFTKATNDDSQTAISGPIFSAPTSSKPSSLKQERSLENSSDSSNSVKAKIPIRLAEVSTDSVTFPTKNEDFPTTNLNRVDARTSHPVAPATLPLFDSKFSSAARMARNSNKRKTVWATNAETRPNPNKYKVPDNGWASDDGGDGIKIGVKQEYEDDGWGPVQDPNSPRALCDWEGKWLPASVEWDIRQKFSDVHLNDKLENWIECSLETVHAVRFYEYHSAGETGEIALLDWLPSTIDGVPFNTWWLAHLRSPGVSQDVEPWWVRKSASHSEILKQLQQPRCEKDPQTANHDKALVSQTADHACRKNDHRQQRKAQSQKAHEKRIRDERNEPYYPPPNQYAPRVNIYLRPARAADMAQISDIYDHYIHNTIFCPERDSLTSSQVHGRWVDVQDAKLPYLVAVDRSATGKRGFYKGPTRQEDHERIVGFGFMDDYNDIRGAYRYCVEAEIFVHSAYLRNGIGRCIMDKLMSIVDTYYVARGGYDFDGDDCQYGPGGGRVVGSVVCNIPYDAKNKDRLNWLQRWLAQWDFQLAGDLFEIGHKKGTSISQAVLMKKTGARIDPWAL